MFSNNRPSRKATTASLELVYFQSFQNSAATPFVANQLRNNQAYTEMGRILTRIYDAESSAIVAYDKKIFGKPIVGHIFFNPPDETNHMITISSLVGENNYCHGVGSILMETVMQLHPETHTISLYPLMNAITFYEKWNFNYPPDSFLMELNLENPLFATWPKTEITEAQLPIQPIEKDPFNMEPIDLNDSLYCTKNTNMTPLLFHSMFNETSYYYDQSHVIDHSLPTEIEHNTENMEFTTPDHLNTTDDFLDAVTDPDPENQRLFLPMNSLDRNFG